MTPKRTDLVERPDIAVAVLENTARRLGVDPVAFAEACMDGSFLADAVLVSDALGRGQAFTGHAELTTHQLAKLKRAESDT